MSILHAGGAEDNSIRREICAYLEPTQIESRGVLERNMRTAEMMLDDLKMYEKGKLPLFVILSENFLKSVCSSAKKSQVIHYITHYPNKRCVHVWAPSVDTSMVKMYSVALVDDSTATFRRVSMEEIRKLRKQDVAHHLQASLHAQTTCHTLDPAYVKPSPFITTDLIDDYRFRTEQDVPRTESYVLRDTMKVKIWDTDEGKELALAPFQL